MNLLMVSNSKDSDLNTLPRPLSHADGRTFAVAVGLCVLLYLSIASFMAFPSWAYCGDDGWYSVAARNVTRGLKPYRDFFFVQMPLSAYAYAAWFLVWGPSITAGRILSVLMSMAAIGLSMITCYRFAGFWPAVVAGLLWSTSIYTAWDLSCIKTQPLCNLLICASFYFVPLPEDSRPLAKATASLAFMSLAFLTRLTLVIPLVFLWIMLAFHCRRRLVAYTLLVGSNVAILIAVWAYFWSDGNMWFGIYRSHRDFYGNAPWTWARLGWTIKYSLGNQLVLAGLLLLAFIRFIGEALSAMKPFGSRLAFPGFLIGSYGAVTAAHWAQVQSYPTHQTVITGFGVVFVAIMLRPIIDAVVAAGRLQAAAAWLGIVAICLPFSESGDLLGIVTARAETDSLFRAGAVLRKHANPGEQFLTFNTELAINGGYELLPGCDLSEWGYFPALADDDADRYRVLNLKHLREALDHGKVPIVIITDRDFGIMAAGREDVAQGLKRLLEEKYTNVAVVKRYGQFQQDLFVFKRIGKTP